MIRTIKDLKRFLAADRFALHRKRIFPGLTDVIWKYEILLRISEYLNNNNSKILSYLVEIKRKRLGLLLGFEIPLNCFDCGLSIAHPGMIIVNSHARIGCNCRIHPGTVIGTATGFEDQVPVIGNNVFIGPGSKIFGGIIIADNICIGSNSVVNKSFLQRGKSIAGVPAKIISEKGRSDLSDKEKKYINDFYRYFHN